MPTQRRIADRYGAGFRIGRYWPSTGITAVREHVNSFREPGMLRNEMSPVVVECEDATVSQDRLLQNDARSCQEIRR